MGQWRQHGDNMRTMWRQHGVNIFWIFEYLTWGPFAGPLSADFRDVEKLASFCSVGYFEF